jgi:hypothetical protein
MHNYFSKEPRKQGAFSEHFLAVVHARMNHGDTEARRGMEMRNEEGGWPGHLSGRRSRKRRCSRVNFIRTATFSERLLSLRDPGSLSRTWATQASAGGWMLGGDLIGLIRPRPPK